MSQARVKKFIVSAGGLGFLPVAPGTFGALAGVAIHVVSALLLSPHWTRMALIAALIVVILTGVFLGRWAERCFGRKDPPPFVLDEVAGYLLVPILFSSVSLWRTVVLAFLTARLFDIIKPPPARRLERLEYGVGIMADDIVASGYAIVTCYAIDRILLPLLNLF